MRVGFADNDAGRIKMGAWTPVWTEVSAGSAPLDGLLELVAPDDLGLPTIARVPVRLAAQESRAVVGYVRVGTPNASIEASLKSLDGRLLSGKALSVRPAHQLGISTKLIVHTSKLPGLDKVAALPKYAGLDAKDRMLAFGEITQWPDDPLGFDGVAAIVIDANDPGVTAALRAGGAKVIDRWVARGGHLVVNLGEASNETAALLGDLLPANPAEATQLGDVGAIETFAGSVTSPLRADVSALRLVPKTDRPLERLAATAVTPLAVRGAYGLGRVTISGLNLTAKPLADWTNLPLIWDKLLDIRGRQRDVAGNLPEAHASLIQSATPELAGQLHQALEQFPQVQLIPFGWVALFILAYLMLIGPIDYFFLKRIAKRMELTWLTFPLIVLLTTAGAFFAAYRLKGTTPRINKLDLLDVDQTSGQVRGTSWWTLYSTANRDFMLGLKPPSPGTAANPWQPLETRITSWFAPDTQTLVDAGRVTSSTSTSMYQPTGALQTIAGVRVPIWSTRSFTGRWWNHAPGIRMVDADVHRIAGDRASGSIRNLLDYPLHNTQLFYGRNVYDVGTIRPRGIGRIDFSKAESVARSLGRLVQDAERAQSSQSKQPANRERNAKIKADLLRAVLFHDAMGNRADTYPSHALADLDMTGQLIELKRPFLVAEVDMAATELSLSGETKAPELEQTTLVRIVLDMAPDSNSAPSNP